MCGNFRVWNDVIVRESEVKWSESSRLHPAQSDVHVMDEKLTDDNGRAQSKQ